jgi:hypothetical protein
VVYNAGTNDVQPGYSGTDANATNVARAFNVNVHMISYLHSF